MNHKTKRDLKTYIKKNYLSKFIFLDGLLFYYYFKHKYH